MVWRLLASAALTARPCPSSHRVRFSSACSWGSSARGQGGRDSSTTIGDDELPSTVNNINFGSGVKIIKLSAGRETVCALSEFGRVLCWGKGLSGELGTSMTSDIGLSSVLPVSRGLAVGLGDYAVDIFSNDDSSQTCAVLSDNKSVYCWGTK